MNLIIQPALLEELEWAYQALEGDEENDSLQSNNFYSNLHSKIYRLHINSSNKNPLAKPDFTPKEIKDILEEIANIETKAVGEDKKVKIAIKLFYIENKFAKEVTREYLEKNPVYSTKTGRSSFPDHYKHNGKYYVVEDIDLFPD